MAHMLLGGPLSNLPGMLAKRRGHAMLIGRLHTRTPEEVLEGHPELCRDTLGDGTFIYAACFCGFLSLRSQGLEHRVKLGFVLLNYSSSITRLNLFRSFC